MNKKQRIDERLIVYIPPFSSLSLILVFYILRGAAAIP